MPLISLDKTIPLFNSCTIIVEYVPKDKNKNFHFRDFAQRRNTANN